MKKYRVMRETIFACAAVSFLCGAVTLQAGTPVVSNVRASQRSGTGLVDIYYDLASASNGLMVSVMVSTNSGAAFNAPAASLSGSLGSGVAPGTGKHVVWNAGTDLAALYFPNVKVRVSADDQVIFTKGTLAQLAAGQRLSIDDKTFSGFSYLNDGLTSFDPSQIIVTATQSGGIDYLTWSGNMSFGSSGIATADLLLKYKVTANAGTINAIDQGYTGSAINGFLTVDETVSTALGGVPIVGSSHLTGLDISDPPAEGNDLLDIVPRQTVLYVTEDIRFAVTSSNGGSITISEVTQSFHQVVVPEPTTIIAGALLLLPFAASLRSGRNFLMKTDA